MPVGAMEGSIDGVEFGVRGTVAATHAKGVLAIAAMDQSGRTVHLTMLSPRRATPVAVGAGEQNSAMTGYRAQSWSSNLVGGTGSVVITAFEVDRAEGTFSFTAIPVPGTNASGMRTVAGRFNVRFVIVD